MKYCDVSLRAAYVSGQYGVILSANFLKEKEGMKLKVYNKIMYSEFFFFIYQVEKG
jgi:hypothetical protein